MNNTISSHLILLFYVVVSPAQEDFVSLAEMEDSLLRNLFRGYQKWVRPVQHANDTITVRFGLKISQLVDVVRTQHSHIQTHRRDVGMEMSSYFMFYSCG